MNIASLKVQLYPQLLRSSSFTGYFEYNRLIAD